MHLTLKQEAVRPAPANLLQQQERFDKFIYEFNFERPHEALKMKTPAELYRSSERRMPKQLPRLEYELADITTTVLKCGRIRMPNNQRCFITRALAGQRVGLRSIGEKVWCLNYADLTLGYVDTRTSPTVTIDNPLGQSRAEMT